MRQRRISLFTLALTALIAASASACGDDDDDPSAPTASPMSATSLGVFVRSPDDAPHPDVRTYEEVCGNLPTTSADPEDAGPLWADANVPDRFHFLAEDLNTGVVRCGDEVFAARWAYDDPRTGASILIVRSTLTDVTEEGAARAQATSIAGRDALLIEPLGPAPGAVVLPEGFGVTWIHGERVTLDELIEVAEAIAR